jgi:hypothetical protein
MRVKLEANVCRVEGGIGGGDNMVLWFIVGDII